MTGLLNDSTASRRMLMWLLGLFGSVALGLAGLGAYAVVSQSMRARWREMGIRGALGARTADILSIMLQQVAHVSAVGIGLGVIGTLWLTTRYLTSGRGCHPRWCLDLRQCDRNRLCCRARCVCAASLARHHDQSRYRTAVGRLKRSETRISKPGFGDEPPHSGTCDTGP